MWIKDSSLCTSMTSHDYIQQIFIENPLLMSDPNYLDVIRSSVRVKYYFDPNLEDMISQLPETLRSLGKLRSEPTVSYPSMVKEGHLEMFVSGKMWT